MAQTYEGAIKIASRQIGITYEQYLQRVNNGEKHCRVCRTWHPISAFASDTSRSDGLTSACKASRNARSKQLYVSIPLDQQQPKGPPPNPPREGDKKQARARVNHLVQRGKIPNPNSLACFDCGHRGDDKRHEYDHYLGYSAQHHKDVQAVCTTCHGRRSVARGEYKRV